MKGVFNRSTPSKSNKNNSKNTPSRPLSLLSPDNAASRRRQRKSMAFMKYGSETTAANDRTREHARRIARQLSSANSPVSIHSASTFADFGDAFPGLHTSSSSNLSRHRPVPTHIRRSRNVTSLTKQQHQQQHQPSFFEQDPFSPSKSQQQQQQQQQTGFEADWPSQEQTMFSMPSSSSMQSKNINTREQTPERPASPTNSVTSSSSNSVTGGAAARRRMRQQMRNHNNTNNSNNNSPLVTKQPPPRLQPNTHDASHQQRDRIASYTAQRQPSSNLSFSSNRSNTSNAEIDLFTVNNKSGFSFDAFGLDAGQINAQVSQAMHDIAGSSDCSFTTDDFFKDDLSSSGTSSRAMTPEPGFVDGFKVQKTFTDNDSDNKNNHTNTNSKGGRNWFKEQAGFGASRPGRKVENPSTAVSSPRSQHDVEFFDDESSSNSSSIQGHTESNQHPIHTESSSAPTPPPTEKSSGSCRSETSQTASTVSTTTGHDEEEPVKAQKGHVKNAFRYSSTTTTTPWQQPQQPQQYRTSNRLAPYEPQQQQQQQQPLSPIATSSVTSNSSAQPEWATARERLKSPGSKSSPRVTPALVDSSPRVVEESPRVVESSPRVVESSPRAAFLGVQLRKTAAPEPVPETLPETAPQQQEEQQEEPPQVPSLEKERKMTYRERRELELQQQRQQQEDDEQQQQAQVEAETVPVEEPTKKMTYRERRELELQKQRQEEEASKPKQEPQRDVASLIKQRIASNRKATSPASADSNGGSSFEAQRVRLKPVQKPEVGTQAVSPVQEQQQHQEFRPSSYEAELQEAVHQLSPSRQSQPSPIPEHEERHLPPVRRPMHDDEELALHPSHLQQSNLEISPEKVQPEKNQASLAVAHLLELQQLQQRQPEPDISAKPPSPKRSPRRGGRMDLSIVPSDDASHVSSDDHARKSITPKATKVMLNAFLAGRESIASNESAQEEVPEEEYSSAKEEFGGAPALKDDPTYQRFFKMLKIGMPMEVVKHAMVREGLDPNVMDGDHNKPVGLPLKMDPTYSKYFRMLSIGLPMEAVKHSMERDGLDSTVMDQDHNLPAKLGPKSTGESDAEKDSHRRARLHWKTLRKVTSRSLWAKIDQESDFSTLQIDEDEFQELFQVEKGAAPTTSSGPSEPAKRGATVRVIDPKRANNGGIILARLKMSHDEMADAVDRIDESALSSEQIENIIEYLPSKEERKSLESYMLEGGQDAAEKFEGLCECEKFMVSMMTVKHAKRKVRALLFKLQFESCVRDIQQEGFTVEEACDELSSSVRLRQLLGIILEFGNRLNTAGNGKQKAGAFTLDSLLKLNQAKAFDKKTTFLNYVVKIVKRNNELLLNFQDDIPTVFKADKVAWDQCVGDLEEVENQLENVRKISLYQARQAQVYRLRKKNKHREEDEESLSDTDMALSLEEEVEALKSTPVGCFTLSAIKYISALRDKVEETKAKFSALLEYFGEEDKKMQPHELFTVMVKFSREFDKAKEQVLAIEKKKLREERKRQATASKKGPGQPGKPPTYSPGPEKKLLRASNHQPSMGNIFTELKSRVAQSVSTAEEPPSEQMYSSPPRRGPQEKVVSPPYDEKLRDAARRESYREQEPVESSIASRQMGSSVAGQPPPSPSSSIASAASAALRAKARMRRQRYAGAVRSSSGSEAVSQVAASSPPRRDLVPEARTDVAGRSRDSSSPSSVRTDSASVGSSNRSTYGSEQRAYYRAASASEAVPQHSGVRAYERSASAGESITPQSNPRSTFRDRRRLEQRRIRHQSATALRGSGLQ